MITKNLLDQMVIQLKNDGANEIVLSDLKQKWADVHFTLCADDDIINAKPVRETPQFNLYLVNTSQHCAVLTNDLDHASGVVIAWRVEEEA